MNQFSVGLRKRLTLLVALVFLFFCAGCKIGDYEFNREVLKSLLESDNHEHEPRGYTEMRDEANWSEWLRHQHNPAYQPEYRDHSGQPTFWPPGFSPYLLDWPQP